MGGIYIDGKLEAFSIGSYNPVEDMAVIHIEKANPDIPGLYQAMNQQFLLGEFPEVTWVNREDDLGLPGLRKAKMSYNPADFARKYRVKQLWGNGKKEFSGVRALAGDEKKETISLWKSCFPEDSREFMDYYYEEKTRDNQILVKEENGEILSMLQRNPYGIDFRGQNWDIDYLVGVATSENRRGEGHMREILTACLRDMNLRNVPFTFLMPAAEAIYRPFDFRFIAEKENFSLRGEFTRVPVESHLWDCKKAADFMKKWLTEHYEIFTRRDISYVERLVKELKSEDGELSFLYDGDLLMGLEAFWGREKREQRLLYTDEKWCVKTKGNPLIMARITNVERFLTAFCLKSFGQMKLWLDITDSLIEENNGSFLWTLTENGSTLARIAEGEMEAAEVREELFVLKTQIADLAPWLFGYKKPEEIWNWLPEDMADELGKIHTVQGVFLDEIV